MFRSFCALEVSLTRSLPAAALNYFWIRLIDLKSKKTPEQIEFLSLYFILTQAALRFTLYKHREHFLFVHTDRTSEERVDRKLWF